MHCVQNITNQYTIDQLTESSASPKSLCACSLFAKNSLESTRWLLHPSKKEKTTAARKADSDSSHWSGQWEIADPAPERGDVDRRVVEIRKLRHRFWLSSKVLQIAGKIYVQRQLRVTVPLMWRRSAVREERRDEINGDGATTLQSVQILQQWAQTLTREDANLKPLHSFRDLYAHFVHSMNLWNK